MCFVLKEQTTHRTGGGHMYCRSAGGAATNLLFTALSGDSAGWQLVCVESLLHSVNQSRSGRGQHFR